MSTAEQSAVYRFRDDVALTLHTRDSSGDLDIRTAYVRPAHALRLACDLIRAAIDCTEQPEERSACGTVERVANDCDNAADAMGEVVRLIDREAGALVSGPEPMPNTRLSAAAYMHLETMEPGSERVLVRQAIRELGRGTGKGYAMIDGRYAEVAGTSRVLGFQQEGDSLHILCIINKGGARR